MISETHEKLDVVAILGNATTLTLRQRQNRGSPEAQSLIVCHIQWTKGK